MALLRDRLHSTIRKGKRNLKEIMLDLNEYLYADTPPHIFVTFILGVYNPKNSEISYCSAGHCRPVVFRADSGRIEVLGAGGIPLEMDDKDTFRKPPSPGYAQIKNRG